MSNINIYNQWSEFINDDKYKQYFIDNNTIWLNNLEDVKKYIDENNKKPSCTDKEPKIKILGMWIACQQTRYKTKNRIMKEFIIYNQWTNFINDDKYKQYFLDNNMIWTNTLEEVKKYIDKNNKRPSSHDKDPNIKKLGYWINSQQSNYINKKDIMKNSDIYNMWYDFINNHKYSEYFIDNNIVWLNILEEVKKYIDTHNKRPSCMCKDPKIKTLGTWIQTQQNNYKTINQIMKDSIIYTTWSNFINDVRYKDYFLDNNIIWTNTLEEVKKYIDINKKKPSRSDTDSTIQTLSSWINTQKINYKNKKNIMKDSSIYTEWTSFITDDKYKSYFSYDE